MPWLSARSLSWSEAYLTFQSEAQAEAKAEKRIRRAGLHRLPPETKVLEIFCGRGAALSSWKKLGFAQVQGLEILPELAAESCFEIIVGDARALPLPDASVGLVAVQAGLHHMESLEDLEKVLREVRRVLEPGGIFYAVEPWRTPFLRTMHLGFRSQILRKLWPRWNAAARMVELEGEVYENWLSSPVEILSLLEKYFPLHISKIAWGRLSFLGRIKASGERE